MVLIDPPRGGRDNVSSVDLRSSRGMNGREISFAQPILVSGPDCTYWEVTPGLWCFDMPESDEESTYLFGILDPPAPPSSVLHTIKPRPRAPDPYVFASDDTLPITGFQVGPEAWAFHVGDINWAAATATNALAQARLIDGVWLAFGARGAEIGQADDVPGLVRTVLRPLVSIPREDGPTVHG